MLPLTGAEAIPPGQQTEGTGGQASGAGRPGDDGQHEGAAGQASGQRAAAKGPGQNIFFFQIFNFFIY